VNQTWYGEDPDVLALVFATLNDPDTGWSLTRPPIR